jgi:DNA-binding transcriptional ArsR family regulator
MKRVSGYRAGPVDEHPVIGGETGDLFDILGNDRSRFGNSTMALGDLRRRPRPVRERPQVVRGEARAPTVSKTACTVSKHGCILNHMVQYTATHLDASFAALADGTRRGVLEQLGRAESSITDLAEKFDMTLTGMLKHVGVLEDAGLVITEKVGRVRNCRIGVRRLDEVATWIDTYHQLWDARFCELDNVVEELKRKEKRDERKREE